MEKYRTFRTLGKLNKEELEELKEKLLIMADDYEEAVRAYDGDLMDEEQLSALFRIRKTQKVTYNDLELFYGGVYFVEEDFFCNCYKEEEEEKREPKRESLGLKDLYELARKLRNSQGFYTRLYDVLEDIPIEKRDELNETIKSWNCYNEIDLIIKIES